MNFSEEHDLQDSLDHVAMWNAAFLKVGGQTVFLELALCIIAYSTWLLTLWLTIWLVGRLGGSNDSF